MSLQFFNIVLEDIKKLMPIETACHSFPWSESTFNSCVGGRYFGEYATLNNSIIGYYVGEYIAGEATLMNICVSPEKQGNGYSNHLLKQFFSQAKSLGASTLFLEVRAKNLPAQMLYINHGFNEISRRTGYYPSASGFGYEDAIVMTKKL